MLRLLPKSASRNGFVRCSLLCPQQHRRRSESYVNGSKPLTVLAIETSCDDTSVAIVQYEQHRQHNSRLSGEHPNERASLAVGFHEKVTANNDAYTGIHPLVALESHRRNLAPLLQKALKKCCIMKSKWDGNLNQYIHEDNAGGMRPPDIVAVTRGPGMRSNLAVGLDTAKGLATAWNVPLIGVHHMQAHALTPRLVTTMGNNDKEDHYAMSDIEPRFPFLSVLVSGGHTMLIDSAALTEHTILAETQDIAIGDCLDKAARAILPAALLRPPFGKALEQFAFHMDISTLADQGQREAVGDLDFASIHKYVRDDAVDYAYKPPARRQDELERRPSVWGWCLSPPLSESKGGNKSSRRMVYSFAGLLSSVERFVKYRIGPDGTLTKGLRPSGEISLQERQDMAREVQRVAFEHLASRILLYLSSVGNTWKGNTAVVSGGVASNGFLRHVLRKVLDSRGYSHIKLSFPPVELCTDNALMIAWTGIEMYKAGFASALDIEPIRKWSIDPKAPDGGIFGVGGWTRERRLQ